MRDVGEQDNGPRRALKVPRIHLFRLGATRVALSPLNGLKAL